MFDLEEELKKLPDKPGVYIMHDKIGTIIYVGKAVSLKNRVRQYFRSSTNHSAKIKRMVSKIDYFEYIITDSELEALVLECNLIKEHSPKYNTMLKDDKTYPFIKITTGEHFPRVLFSRKIVHGTGKYYGPYTSAGAVKDTIELLCKLYKIRTCNRKLPADQGRERPCLNYHIGQCSAPCQGYINEEDYRKSIESVMEFLDGDYSHILKSLTQQMQQASENMEFEEAAKYRDLIASVKQVAQKQKITMDDVTDRDVIAVACDGQDAVVQVFFVRSGKLLGRDHFHMSVAEGDTRGEILSQFIKQYYGGTPYIPNVVMIQEEIEDSDVISQWLSGIKKRKVNIITPKKGDKEKLVELAYRNAQMVLIQDGEKIKREQQRTVGAMEEIAGWIHLSGVRRVEAYDISNTSGVESVGSMVVFQDGKPARNDYRKFKIKTVKGPDDYKSMKEVLTRRFKRALESSAGFDIYPDLIMMDGGKGQVNIALEVLEELGLSIPVCGMVKDDNHNTRGLYYNNVEIPVDKRSEGFKLITRIQDEAHRFAIEYHRSLRSKAQVSSVLDGIDGVGPARRKALMKHFMEIEKIRHASVEELMEATGINRGVAENIYNYFH
ncbi:MAG: excinuclease ABC subunit UvrC [Lachnospira sp.]|nr:excinuclease ABC subunit UvrC [Lachnospira sp.]